MCEKLYKSYDLGDQLRGYPSLSDRKILTQRAAENLLHLPARPRQAFILASVEGFEPAQVAEILDLDEAEAGTLLAEASREISSQVATDILIIEDEEPSRRFLRATLEANHYRVKEAGTARDGTLLAVTTYPDIILLDLGLPDGDGLKVTPSLLPLSEPTRPY